MPDYYDALNHKLNHRLLYALSALALLLIILLPLYTIKNAGAATADSHFEPGVAVQNQVRTMNGAWSNAVNVTPGTRVHYRIVYTNTSKTTQKNVVFRDNLPPDVSIVPSTTMLKNSANPNGIISQSSTGISGNGVVLGNYGPGANAIVTFDATMPSTSNTECGKTIMTNVGVARPEGMSESFNSSVVNINRSCIVPKKKVVVTPTVHHTTKTVTTHTVSTPAAASHTVTTTTTTPVSTVSHTHVIKTTAVAAVPKSMSCSLQVTSNGDRSVTVRVTRNSQGGASASSLDYSFGDGNSISHATSTMATHVYANDGTFHIVVTPNFFNSNNTDEIAGSSCSHDITIHTNAAVTTTPVTEAVTTTNTAPVTSSEPVEIANTGAGNVVGIFAITAVLAAGGHYFYSWWRASRNID